MPQKKTKLPTFKVKGLLAAGIITRTHHQGQAYWESIRQDPCVYCGRPSETKEHLQPKSKKGIDGWENCVRACKRCNQSRGRFGNLPFLVFMIRYGQKEEAQAAKGSLA